MLGRSAFGRALHCLRDFAVSRNHSKIGIFHSSTYVQPSSRASTKFGQRILREPELSAANWEGSAVGATRCAPKANRNDLSRTADRSGRAPCRNRAPSEGHLRPQRSAPWKPYRNIVRSWRIEAGEESARSDRRNE